jgi:hypothetical protein
MTSISRRATGCRTAAGRSRAATLYAYYAAAQLPVEIGPPTYDPLAWQDDKHRFPSSSRSAWYADPAAFGRRDPLRERYRDDLAKADNVRVLLNANTLGVGSTAEATNANRCAAGRPLRACAQAFAPRRSSVACGGLESPRVLLLSNDVVSAGLGNQRDLDRALLQWSTRTLSAVASSPPMPAAGTRASAHAS